MPPLYIGAFCTVQTVPSRNAASKVWRAPAGDSSLRMISISCAVHSPNSRFSSVCARAARSRVSAGLGFFSRPNVTWPVKFFSPGSGLNGPTAVSICCCKSTSRPAPSLIPTQMTRGARRLGKKPMPSARKDKGRAFRQTAPADFFKSSTPSAGTSPRNRSVRWN